MVQAFPPSKVIFVGIGVLLSVCTFAVAVRGPFSSPTFIGGKKCEREPRCARRTLERIENFFSRLALYTQVSFTTKMAGVLVKVVSEVLSILSIATKEVRRKRASELFVQDILNT